MIERGHTVIVGAGIVGVSAAYELARRGHAVTVVDKGEVGSGASFGNAGIIAVGHPPLPRPGLVWQSLKWMLDPGSPLYIKPRFDFELIRWLWQFMRACNPRQFAASIGPLTELGIASKQCFDRIVADERIECEYKTAGWYELFMTQRGLEHGRHDAALLRGFGLTVDEFGGAEARRREPAFTEHVVAAIHYVDSAIAEPRRYVVELADRATRHGASVRTSAQVSRIEMRDGRFITAHLNNGDVVTGETLVLAAGSWTTNLAAAIGVNVPMQPAKGYHLELTAPRPIVSTACVLAERAVAATPMNSGLRLAGTVELSGLNHHLVQRRLDMLPIGARAYLRGIDQCTPRSSWCGLRPCTADGMPVIGWAPRCENVFIATGHAKMGFALGPITGRLVSECILDDEPSLDLSSMSPSRFAGGAAPRRAGRGAAHLVSASC
jgi:D-amino-acid dehydrogenase